MTLFGNRLEWCIHKPRNAKNCQQILEAPSGKEGFPPIGFRGRVTVLTIHFCCFRPPSVWHFVMPVLGNAYTPSVQTSIISYLDWCSDFIFVPLLPSPTVSLLQSILQTAVRVAFSKVKLDHVITGFIKPFIKPLLNHLLNHYMV